MGANAQTTVPTFTSGQVLTAAQMNNSARTGVPVFATTTDRDAGFGGAGEKTLAEGQLAYIEATDVVQYYDGSTWKTLAPGGVIAADTASVLTNQSTTSTTYTDLATVGPSVTLTTGTKVVVAVTCYTDPSSAGASGAMSFAVSGATTTAANDDFAAGLVGLSASGWAGVISWVGTVTVTAGSNTFTAKYKRGSAATHNFQDRYITVWAL